MDGNVLAGSEIVESENESAQVAEKGSLVVISITVDTAYR